MDKKKRSNNLFLGILACVLLLAAAIAAFGAAGAFASLGDTTAVVKTSLQPAKVGSAVNQDYTVTNTGNIPAVVRVKLFLNWVDEEGNPMMYPPEGASFALTPGSGWMHHGNADDPTHGYWYCKSIVAPGKKTPALIEELTQTGDGSLRVEILAEAIQATPAEAAKDAWGMSFKDGVWSK